MMTSTNVLTNKTRWTNRQREVFGGKLGGFRVKKLTAEPQRTGEETQSFFKKARLLLSFFQVAL